MSVWRFELMLTFQVVTVLLVALAMALSVAHALEYPGKLRLSRENYIMTQTIYYPGFTIGGVGEALSLVASLALIFMMPRGSASFWWSLAAFLALALMHAVFWFVTQPVNRYWAANLNLTSGAARQFFGVDQKQVDPVPEVEWQRLRDKWEYSHIARAVFATIGLVCVTVAIAL
jgi:hypothetical protein